MAYATLFKETAPAPKAAPWGFRLAGFLFNPLVTGAELEIRAQSDGSRLRLGQAGAQSFVMVIDKPELLGEIVRTPDPGLGEAYMEGRWHLQEGDMGAFISMLGRGREKIMNGPLRPLIQGLYRFYDPPDYAHDVHDCARQVRHHYDLGNDLYEMFLDPSMNYSCAFFDDPHQSLEKAQFNKVRTAIKRLDIRADQQVLDIGCGWGNVCRVIAGETPARAVTGITLAENQLYEAERRSRFMSRRPDFLLEDYREHAARRPCYYDRIVSIGMFEHVGHENNGAYFDAVRTLLKPGGKALIHSIVRSGRATASNVGSPWLDRYIFPGGCIPDLHDMIRHAQNAGLELAHAPYIHESFNYAETLRRWRANFMEGRHRLDPARYDARFQRMWIYYLAMCEAIFDGCGYRVAQVLLRKV